MDYATVACVVVGGCLATVCAIACRLRRAAPKVRTSDIIAIGHKFVTLPDGRVLEYSVSGDPNGVPVYYQHGYMCSCFVNSVWKAVAAECGVKLIAASMPGFGFSDSYPLGVERSLLDWPTDVLAVLSEEGVSKVHLFGISAGCVHVAALAHGLPSEMIGNVCFVNPTCPDEVPGALDQMAFSTRVLRKIMGKPYIGDLTAYLIARKMSPRGLLAALPDCKAALERADREMPELSQGFITTFERGLQFTYRGIVDNACTIDKPLPFNLRELAKLTQAGRAIAITSADDDTTTPPIMQQWFQKQIEGSTIMKFASGWGHLHSMPPANYMRILRFLVTGEDPIASDSKTLRECEHQQQHPCHNKAHLEDRPLLD